MNDAPRILIVRLSALGDVVHALPALAALRQALPGAHLGWAVEDKAAGLLEGHPQLDRVHVVPRQRWKKDAPRAPLRVAGEMRAVVRELRAERYDVTLDFQSNFRSASLARLSGAPRRIGQPRPFSKEGSRFLMTEAPAPVAPDEHKIVRNLALLEPLGVRPEAPPRPVVGPPRGAVPALAGRGPHVLLHPGVSAFGALKAWQEGRWAELATALVARGCEVHLSWGGAQERALVGHLVELAPGARVAPETGGLLGFAALLRQVSLVVGVDSGPLHLAAALGTPVLGLYGPKHVGTYGPFWPRSGVARAGFECSPCKHRRCPRPDARTLQGSGGSYRLSPCMEALEVDLVVAEAERLLAAPARPERAGGPE